MKKIKFILLIMLIANYLFGQSWEWANGYGTSGYNRVHSIDESDDGNIFISGSIRDTTIFGNDTLHNYGLYSLGYIAKMSSEGNPIWAKPYFVQNGTTQAPASFFYVSVASDNSLVLSSHFEDMLIVGNDTLYEENGEMFVAHLDDEGSFLWAKNFGDNRVNSNSVQASRNHVDQYDNIYLTGTFHDTAYFQTDTLIWQEGEIFIVKFDKNGNEKWVRQCGKAGDWQRGYDITTDSFGNVYITGTIPSGQSYFGNTIIQTPANRNNTYIAKLDALGNFEWAITGGGATDHPGGGQIIPSTYGTAIKTDGTNTVYFSGFFSDTVQFGGNLFYPNCGYEYCGNFFLASYDLEGNFNWFTQSSTATARSSGHDIEIDEEGNIYVAGTFQEDIGFGNFNLVSSINSNDLFVAKFNPLGECVGLINSNANTLETGIAFSCLNQSIHVAGSYGGASGDMEPFGVEEAQSYNIFVGAISNSFECEIISNIYEVKNEVLSIYPNPFQESFQIDLANSEYSFPQYLNVHIFNSVGQLVHKAVLENATETINCAHLNNGLFYVQIFNSTGEKIAQPVKLIKIE